MRHLVFAALALVSLTPALGAAQPFAEPPDHPGPAVASSRPYDSYDQPYDRPYDRPYDDYYQPRSTVRIHTGPVLRISEASPDGGLFAAVDVGQKAAGLRVSGAWVRVGGERGLSQYGGELWLDFNHTGPLHPILGAGAAAARVQLDDGAGGTESHTIGVGTLRGTLQYALPIRDTDARASIDLIGAVPAIRGSDSPNTKAYLLALATVGVGF
ncbi:MAG: hypothetical protein HS104_12960 [Polyangiaceae bacterium]|nr:hypothetical protein [Polyangiaceae bacterium]MBK8995943.1 hypothetical protein [Myxococcales bacterium]MCE7893860.1 hypothetical protein [Sorangiineae bacterium PRO1]MCL4755986.1 hypothetical protein [Myxococcales bacterium]